MDNTLRELLETASAIFIKANESYLFAKYFDTANSDAEKSVIKRPSIRFIQHSLWKNCIIELDKIFGISGVKNDYSFINIFTYIRINQSALFTEMSDYTMLYQKWTELRKSKQPLIVQINNLRKKLYAHTDKGKEKLLSEIDISYIEIEELLKETLSLIKEIYVVLFDTDYDYKPIFYRNVEIVQTIAEKQKLTREERVNQILGKNPRP
ncbi:hypothetical protein HHL23_09575 [Chryseobacterium sp. RP-3-3]|uniref:HEPN AbiU2-like domain-containing protein n=1 Tax=Chryseobacterium antibioticum TaxID=2728847 RepID=A0A7Y0FRU1_9FLAO|nr:hypothetical protein [Chryseobacterium antibioticum]NML70050.1 hypothetical protein [Chryseobacterium antibioticum]